MTTSATRSLAQFAAVLTAGLLAAACATTGGYRPAAHPPPSAPPTSAFGPALRCMDTLLLDHGVRDLSVIVEDLADPSQQKAQAGTKEMLVTAVSDMTQRSRAVRLVASNAEWGQTVAVMNQAQKRDPYAVAPQFALRGTLRSLDGGRAISLDLTLLTTQDMSVVPGTATQNAALLKNGNAEFVKFGQTITVPAGSVAHAQRALAELAVIELFGRLAKVPYWSCLGANADNPAVAGGDPGLVRRDGRSSRRDRHLLPAAAAHPSGLRRADRRHRQRQLQGCRGAHARRAGPVARAEAVARPVQGLSRRRHRRPASQGPRFGTGAAQPPPPPRPRR